MNQAIQILLVEDNPGDVRLTQESLREARAPIRMSVVEDGVKALAFLRKENEFANAPRPRLILLDLNLPKKDGRAVLAEIKADQSLLRIPVIVLTTSKDEQDVLRSYDLHANCHVTKPMDLDQFSRMVKSIENFWLATVELPANGE